MSKSNTIIAIGTGRSGSTLLTRILNEHPEIRFGGEIDFLAPRLWGELWENRFWFHWKIQMESGTTSAVSRSDNQALYNLRSEFDIAIPEQVKEQSRQKTASVIQATIKRLLEIEDSNVLGYKEPWNGSGSFLYDWKIYDNVFPGAVWLHLVRDPFTYAKSCSQWVRNNLDMDFLVSQLKVWVSVIKYSRERNTAGKYFEIRYEDLIRSTKGVLQPVLHECGLEWVEACSGPLQKSVMKFSASALKIDSSTLTLGHIEYLFKHIDGLQEMCEKLDYLPKADTSNYFTSFEKEGKPKIWKPTELNLRKLERETELAQAASAREAELVKAASARETELVRAASTREAELLDYLRSYAVAGEKSLKRTRLKEPYLPESGLCWAVTLVDFLSIADSEEHPRRSTLLLYEDDKLLQPSHAPHKDIRNLGGGRYSHWNEDLYFSTSDGSDPNTNGREYRIIYTV